MERPELELWGLCEMNPERVGEVQRAATRACARPPSFDEVLADPTVDAVSIATPPRTHYPLVKQALEAGKHVLVEKPLATNAADAEALVELAERKGLVLMPGPHLPLQPARSTRCAS